MKRLSYQVLASAILVCIGWLEHTTAQSATSTSPEISRERLSLDRAWLFYLGDIPFPEIKGQAQTYESAKAGRAWGAAAPDFDDSNWRQLDLPHDWAVESPFDPKANLAQGYRPRGVGWYRRHFKLDKSEQGKHLELQFDGVATHCVVWVNGILAHRNWSGYNSFAIDLTPFAKYGEEINSISVRVDANPMEGWWYEGAGIYRHTWLVKRNPVHIITDSVFANPIRTDDGSWTIPVEATLASCAKEPANVKIETALIDPTGSEVGSSSSELTVNPLEESVARLPIPVASPQLWSTEEPILYELRTIVTWDNREVDRVTTHCGFRTIRFDADQGFFLNDAPLELKGVCNHQDHAGVGVAVPDSLWEFRLRRLKEMGANAYRCAHHPPAAEFLDACDRLGMLVMNENRNFNTTPEYMRQLEWLVRRDRNHPSVILWSVFNEEPMQGTSQGYEMVRRMAKTVKQLDATRPVTAAQSNSMFSPVNASQAADVAGFNYQHGDYAAYHAANPTKPVVSSEDTSAVMTRGEYQTDKKRAVLNSYDTEFQPWGATHRDAWRAIAEQPFMAGGFVWTGFDYHGEPQPLEWPATGSSFGCLDLCGFPKTGFYIRQAFWIEDRPILHLVPHWNWSGKQNEPIKVMAISNADSVALSLNGTSLGEKSVDRFEMVSWDVPYEPGRLEAIATEGGIEVARIAVQTTGPPAELQLIADRNNLAGDGSDAVPVTVQAVDAEGRPVPDANLPVTFTLQGPGKIIGLGNGDPNCHESEKGDKRSLFNGLAQVIVQSNRESSGQIKLRADSAGLSHAEIEMEVASVAAPPEVPAVKPEFIAE
jgi:beta-galactosidase